MQWCRRDKVALRTTCIKNVKFKIFEKDRLSVFRILILHYSENLNWDARNLRLGRGLDIAGLGFQAFCRLSMNQPTGLCFHLLAMILTCTCLYSSNFTPKVKHARNQSQNFNRNRFHVTLCIIRPYISKQ